MWLRMVRAHGLIGREIVAIALDFEQNDLEGITQLPGYLATGLGVNIDRGGSLVLVFWDSEEHMLESDALADAARARLTREFQRKDPYLNDGLEVIFASDVIALEGAIVTPFIHLAQFDELDDDALERMTEVCLGDARIDARSRGCEGVVVAVDRAKGTLAMITFWESMRDMRAVRREYTGSVPGVDRVYTDNFELVIARDLARVGATTASG